MRPKVRRGQETSRCMMYKACGLYVAERVRRVLKWRQYSSWRVRLSARPRVSPTYVSMSSLSACKPSAAL